MDWVGSTYQSRTDRFTKRGATTRRVSVAAVDFVDCLRTLGVPHSMKIDIEGSGLFGADPPADGWMDRMATAAPYDRNFALVRTCGGWLIVRSLPAAGTCHRAATSP